MLLLAVWSVGSTQVTNRVLRERLRVVAVRLPMKAGFRKSGRSGRMITKHTLAE